VREIIVLSDKVLVPYLYDEGWCEMYLHPMPDHQVFTFMSGDGTTYHFDILKLNDMIEMHPSQYKVETYAIRAEDIDHIVKFNGIEQEHIDRIPESEVNKFGIIIQWQDSTQTIINGNHRMVKRFRLGYDFMKFYVLTMQQTKKSLLAIPPEVSSSLMSTNI
jgi:hypothetical protein